MGSFIEDMSARKTATETANACHDLHQSGVIPEYEDILADNYRRFLRPGDVAIDIGVNHGFHYDRLKECVGPTGRVIGFEPVPDFIAVVRERRGDEMEIRQKALSIQPGHGTFLHMTGAIGESGFKERDSEDANRGAKKIDVEISTLDIELPDLNKLDFMKIDVEGHEISVLGGGGALLNRTRPLIAVEYGHPTYSLYGHTARSLYAWSSAVGYCISDLWGNLVRSREEWDYVCDHSYWDYFLVPQEKAAAWSTLHS